MDRDMTETDKAYLAGIIDGEGSIVLKRSRIRSKTSDAVWTYYRLELRVGNTSIELLEWIKQFGGNYYYEKTKDGQKPRYQWCITTRGAAEILEEVLPYLIIKREKAEAAIYFQNIRKPSRLRTDVDREEDRMLHEFISPGARKP